MTLTVHLKVQGNAVTFCYRDTETFRQQYDFNNSFDFFIIKEGKRRELECKEAVSD